MQAFVLEKLLDGRQSLEALALTKADAQGLVHYIDGLQEMWDKALAEAAKGNKGTAWDRAGQDGKRFSIREFADGTYYVEVDTDQDIFEGADRSEYGRIARKYINVY